MVAGGFLSLAAHEWGGSSFQRTARFVSNIYGPGTSFFDVDPPTLYKGALNDISREFYLDVLVRDAGGNPLPDRSVTLRDNSGAVVFSGTTDGSGTVRTSLADAWLTSRSSYSPAVYFTPSAVGSLNRIDSNPYTVTVEGVTKSLVVLDDEVVTFQLP